jgi:hypothetical protein
VLAGAEDIASIDDESSTLTMDGVLVGKPSAFRVLFGRGSPKSNDRLKRVRGIGRSRMLAVNSHGDTDDKTAVDLYKKLSQI